MIVVFLSLLFGRAGAAMEASASRRCRDVPWRVSTTRFVTVRRRAVGLSAAMFLARHYRRGE